MGCHFDSAPTHVTHYDTRFHLAVLVSISELVMDLYDEVIEACPLFVVDGRHTMTVDLNRIEVLVRVYGLDFEQWFTELLGLCPAITVNFVYSGVRTVVVY